MAQSLEAALKVIHSYIPQPEETNQAAGINQYYNNLLDHWASPHNTEYREAMGTIDTQIRQAFKDKKAKSLHKIFSKILSLEFKKYPGSHHRLPRDEEDKHDLDEARLLTLAKTLKNNTSVLRLSVEYYQSALCLQLGPSLEKILTTNKTLRALSLKNTHMNAKEAEALISGVSCSHSLSELSLNNVGGIVDWLSKLFKALEDNTVLRYLHITGVYELRVHSICTNSTLQTAIYEFSSIPSDEAETLILKNSRAMAEMLTLNHTLTSLRFNQITKCEVDDKALKEALQRNPSLTFLDLEKTIPTPKIDKRKRQITPMLNQFVTKSKPKLLNLITSDLPNACPSFSPSLVALSG